jgi:Kef-type K+ transport system membrane component KefB
LGRQPPIVGYILTGVVLGRTGASCVASGVSFCWVGETLLVMGKDLAIFRRSDFQPVIIM